VRLFDLWFDDLRHGEYISIRHLDNWLSILLGERPEACNMAGCCSVQFVVEGDGGVYPCDFYVLDEWRLGNIGETGLADMQNSETAKRFVRQSLAVPKECKTCQWFGLCRNGCRRDRDILPNGVIGQNIYCAAYRKFFTERFRQLTQSIECIQRMQYR
ncbi:MAG: SPASM domain-containing protein, partial [Agathobaculum butyriciproducens]